MPDNQTLKDQKKRHVADLLAQYEAGEHLSLKTSRVKAGLALVLGLLAEAAGPLAANSSGSGDPGGGGTYGPDLADERSEDHA